MINKNKLALMLGAFRRRAGDGGWRIAPAAVGMLAVLLLASCGKKSESTDEAGESRSTLEEIARQALSQGEEGDAAAAKQMVQAAGFEVKSIGEYPSYWAGVNGRMLIYAGEKSKSGGVVYGAMQAGEFTPVWHWFFSDDVPKSAEPVELNDDGLWDVRLTMESGKTLTFIQDKDFSLMRPGRGDWIAQNGASSPSVSDDDATWRCFDSDSTTAWRSSVGAGKKAFIDLPAPFGVGDGVLMLRTTASDQPRHGTLYADGHKVQDFELEKKAASQMFKLGPEAKGARSIRLEFDTAYGGGDRIAVAELGIK